MERQNEKIQEIGSAVSVLREVAQETNSLLDQQNRELSHLETKVDDTSNRMKFSLRRLTELLKNSKGESPPWRGGLPLSC